MNKNLYRIIFNKARNMFMAVAENVRSQSKAAGQSSSSEIVSYGQSSGQEKSFHQLWHVKALVTSMSLLVPFAPVYADIVADSAANAANRAIIAAGKNSAGTTVPVVNIQTPKNGISHNIYKQFDVLAEGAVLNNSRQGATTKTVGAVAANPFLATGEARVILNEVNSSAASRFEGNLEVAGQMADVIIANPSGINIKGGGFINANKAIFTTGKPQLNADGSIKQFTVDQGRITVSANPNSKFGLGGNNNDANYVDLYARALELSAELRAKNDIQVIAGANNVSADLQEVTAKTGTGTAPALAVDVKALGGMYANNIYLMGTEKGLGVTNAGTIQAVNNLVITSAGKIENNGTIKTTGSQNSVLNLSSQNNGDFTSSGAIQSNGNIFISSDRNLALNGGKIDKLGTTLSSIFLSAKGDVSLQNDVNIQNAGVGGGIYSDSLNFNLGKDSNILSQGDISLLANNNIDIQNGKGITSNNDLSIQSKNNLNIANSSIESKAGNVNLISLGNTASSLLGINNTKLYAGKDFNIKGAKNIKLNSSIVQENSNNINLYAGNDIEIGNDVSPVSLKTQGTINIAAKNNLILRTDTSLLTKKDIDVQTDIGNLYAKSLNVSSSEGKVSILGNGNVNLETQNDGWYTLKNRINAKNGIILGSKGENAITKINTVDLKSTDGNVLLLSGGDLTLDGNNGYTTGMKAAVASGFINAKDVTLWSKTGVLDISSGVINASNGGISIRAGNNAQVHDIDLNSTKNIEINSDKDLILERTNTRANQHIALSSKGNINAYQNYILDAKGVLSAISNGSIDGQGYGGAVIVEANQLSNNGIDFRATGSELLQLDTKLKNINGNLSIQLNKDFVIKPTHGHDTITLVAENDIDVRSKQGAIRIEGENFAPNLNEAGFVGIISRKGGLSLEGTSVDIKGTKINVQKDINIVSTKGDLVIDGIADKVNGVSKKKDLINSQDDQEKKNFIANTITGVENFNSELSTNTGNINISSKKGVSITGANIDAKQGIVNIQAQGVLNGKYRATAKKEGTTAKELSASIIIDGNLDVYEKGNETDQNYSYREYVNPTNINGNKGVNIRAIGKTVNDNLVLQGVGINSAQGDVNIEADKSILFDTALETLYDRSTKTETKRSWYGKKKTTTTTTIGDVVTPASVDIYGKNINVISQFKNPLRADGTRDPALNTSVDIYSARFNANGGKISIRSGGDLNFLTVAAVNNSNVNQVKKSSWLGINLGTSKTNATRNQTTEIPAKLKADYIGTKSGYDTRLEGTEFTYLKSATIEAGGTITLVPAKNLVEESLNRKKNSVVWQSMQDKGSITETAQLPNFNGPQPPVFNAAGGLSVQVPISEKDVNKVELRDAILKLANQPGSAYLKDLVNRKDIDWQTVLLTQKDWDYKSEGLTAAGAAIIVIIVTIATMGSGTAAAAGAAGGTAASGTTVGLGASMLGTAGVTTTAAGAIVPSTLGAMANAAVTSLAAQASIGLINNGGDIGKTLKEMGSKDSIKNLAASVVTAGLLSQVGTALNLKPDSTLLSDRLANNFASSVGSTLVQTAINGGDLGDNLQVALLAGLAGALQGELASQIGTSLDKVDPNIFEYTIHKIAHAVVGCATAAATKQSCEAGAIGAGVGEIVAELMIPAGKTALDLTDAERTKIKDTSKLIAGTTAAFAGYDVNTAANSANIAVENNTLGKLATTAGKAAYRVAKRITDMPASVRANLKPDDVIKIFKEEGVQGVIDIGDNIKTLISPTSTPGDRAFAAIDLLIGIDLKAGKNVDILKSEKNIIGKNYSAGLNREILNKAGDFYPNVPDLRTGRTISFPVGDLKKVPELSRVSWGAQERGKFIQEWYKRGYETPRGGWSEYDIHHIKPREFGGTNEFWNLTPVQRKTHQQEFNSFWRNM
ncbi:DUF637 domain-containing protein [Acinetobacter baumannii]|uniref:two-partner secretion domain-containing protein n=1 Tax=Acinetobacter baumannii TaxID=470 RepID=UPI0038B4EE55